MPNDKSNDKPKAPPLLKVAQVAEALSCSPATVYALIEQGKLTAIKIGAGGSGLRVRPSDLDAFIVSRMTGPKPKQQPVRQVFLKHLR